jgi:hypothetical protein
LFLKPSFGSTGRYVDLQPEAPHFMALANVEQNQQQKISLFFPFILTPL